jgi:LAO/AO transport system kinase
MSLTSAVLDGDRLALARLLSHIENNTEEGRTALNELFPHTGGAHLIGVTGAPGTGKSTLVNQLAYHYRHPQDDKQPKRVAVVAVDPSSPFSGGAILGDRIRMRDLAGDPGVFIRSMASRGWLGGLASTTAAITQAFDAAGYEIVLIETVGAGQAEVDVASLAHTTLVVEAPGLGDDIQAIKAGILEIADILVVNKADRPGAEVAARILRNTLRYSFSSQRTSHHSLSDEVGASQDLPVEEEDWLPPVLCTVATKGEGIPELIDHISCHRDYLKATGGWELRERARLQAELENLVRDTLMSRWRETVTSDRFEATLEQLLNRQKTPQQALRELLDGGQPR